MYIECVLVRKHVAPVEGCQVRVYTQGHGLFPGRSSSVLESDVSGKEVASNYSCILQTLPSDELSIGLKIMHIVTVKIWHINSLVLIVQFRLN